MRKLFEKIWKKEEGFTLIELIIVIAILAVIAAIAIPNVLSAVDNSRRTTDVSNAKIIADAAATVRAMDDTHSNYVGTEEVTSTNTDTFIIAVVNKLNGVAPEPKYKGGSAANAATFVLNVAANGNITVDVGNASGVVLQDTATPANDLELFPTPHADYTNQ